MAQSGSLPITFVHQKPLFVHSTQFTMFIMASHQSVVNRNIILKFPIGHKAFFSLCTMSHFVLLSLKHESESSCLNPAVVWNGYDICLKFHSLDIKNKEMQNKSSVLPSSNHYKNSISWKIEAKILKTVIPLSKLRPGAHLYSKNVLSKNVFCLNVLECVFPMFNIGVPHTYTAENKNTVQHDPARYKQNRACSKQKHWPLFEDKTLSCACAFNTQVSLSM